MTTNLKQTVAIILLMTLAFFSVKTLSSQTLTINPKILLNGKYTLETVKVTVIDMDTTLDSQKSLTFNVRKECEYMLEDNKEYLIVFQVDGFQTKSVMITTNYTSNEPVLYTFEVDLSNKDFIPEEVRYAGGIFYDNKKNKFSHYKTKLVQFAEN